jgi:hypothetical protein
VLHLLERLADSPAVVMNDLGGVLAWTPLTEALSATSAPCPSGSERLELLHVVGLQRLVPEAAR